jgi:hypothetical protein
MVAQFTRTKPAIDTSVQSFLAVAAERLADSSDSGLLADDTKAADAADRRATRAEKAKTEKKPAKTTTRAKKTDKAITVTAHPIDDGIPDAPAPAFTAVEIKRDVFIVKPNAAGLQADEKTQKALTAGLSAIAAKQESKKDKKPVDKGWKLPGGSIAPVDSAEKLSPLQKGSIMDTIVKLMVKGSTQAEFEAAGVGRGGNPFTYLRVKKGYGCRKDGDRFFITYPTGVTEPVYALPKVKAEKVVAEAPASAEAKLTDISDAPLAPRSQPQQVNGKSIE